MKHFILFLLITSLLLPGCSKSKKTAIVITGTSWTNKKPSTEATYFFNNGNLGYLEVKDLYSTTHFESHFSWYQRKDTVDIVSGVGVSKGIIHGNTITIGGVKYERN